jgi:hypothetical protein
MNFSFLCALSSLFHWNLAFLSDYHRQFLSLTHFYFVKNTRNFKLIPYIASSIFTLFIKFKDSINKYFSITWLNVKTERWREKASCFNAYSLSEKEIKNETGLVRASCIFFFHSQVLVQATSGLFSGDSEEALDVIISVQAFGQKKYSSIKNSVGF